MTLREALEKGEVDRALDVARNLNVDEALAEAREVALGEGTPRARAAATTVMARLAVVACPLPGSPATDTPDVIAAKEKARAAFLADQRATLLRLVGDATPDVVGAAATALIEATEDADLDALRPQLEPARIPLERRAAGDGDAAVALLRLAGGRAAVSSLVDLAAGRLSAAPLEALTSAVARSPVPEALAPLLTLLENEERPFARHLVGGAKPGEQTADRVRGLAQAIAAIDRNAAARVAERAPDGARASIEDGIVDDAIRRLVTARSDDMPALQRDLAGLLPALEARCAAGDVRAVPAALRLGGEALAVRWIEAAANGDTAPAPLADLADEAARLHYRGAAAPLAQIVENANAQARSSAAWAALLGHDAAAAVRALRVLDPARASALVDAAPAALRQRFDAESQ